MYTIGKVKFLVSYDPLANYFLCYYGWVQMFFPGIVFLTIRRLDFEYFDTVIAHELAHLQKESTIGGKREREMEAWDFAAKILGKDRVKKTILMVNPPYKDFFIKSLEKPD